MSWPPTTGRRRHFRLTILSSEGSYPTTCFKADDALFHSSSSLVYTAVPYEPPNEFGFSEIAWTTVGEIRLWGAIAFAIQEGKGFYSFYPLSGVSIYAATFDEQVLHRTALHLAARNPAQSHELHWVAAATGEITQLYAALLRANNVLLRGVSCYLKSHMLWKHHFFMEEMGINLHIALEAGLSVLRARLSEQEGRAVAFRDVYVEEFAQRVAEDLKAVAGQVDQAYLQTDEFAHIFERSFKGAAEHYQRDKLDAFRAILVNSAVRSDVAQEEKEHFLVLANNLSVLQLRILMFMAEPRRFLAGAGVDERRITGGFADMFRTVLPGMDLDLVKSAFGDLYQSGLITTDKTIFGTMTSAQGLQLLGDRVTPLGHRFIRFLHTPTGN